MEALCVKQVWETKLLWLKRVLRPWTPPALPRPTPSLFQSVIEPLWKTIVVYYFLFVSDVVKISNYTTLLHTHTYNFRTGYWANIVSIISQYSLLPNAYPFAHNFIHTTSVSHFNSVWSVLLSLFYKWRKETQRGRPTVNSVEKLRLEAEFAFLESLSSFHSTIHFSNWICLKSMGFL